MWRGFSLLYIVLFVAIVVAVGFLALKLQAPLDQIAENTKDEGMECDTPPVFPSPVDINLASGVLYPGQVRGSDYKPHGGFRFDNRNDGKVEVRAIMDGYILKASRYEDDYAVQHLLFYANTCGFMVMHDHLSELTPKFEQVFSKIPLGKNGDSRTTVISPKVYIEKGELIATKIGYEYFPGGYNDKNIFVDFGVYDLNNTNGVVYDDAFRAKHPNIDEYGTHALCWLDHLEEPARSKAKSLPAGGMEGVVSDYCQ